MKKQKTKQNTMETFKMKYIRLKQAVQQADNLALSHLFAPVLA